MKQKVIVLWEILLPIYPPSLTPSAIFPPLMQKEGGALTVTKLYYNDISRLPKK